MTYDEFYEKLVELSMYAPTDGIRSVVLDLQIALDVLEDCDDLVGEELNLELKQLFD